MIPGRKSCVSKCVCCRKIVSPGIGRSLDNHFHHRDQLAVQSHLWFRGGTGAALLGVKASPSLGIASVLASQFSKSEVSLHKISKQWQHSFNGVSTASKGIQGPGASHGREAEDGFEVRNEIVENRGRSSLGSTKFRREDWEKIRKVSGNGRRWGK